MRDSAVALVLCLLATACGERDPAHGIIEEAIRAHGSDRLENVDLRFTFRDARFRLLREEGAFLYERTYADSTGATIREWMTNDETGREVDGARIPLDADARASVETSVHSVVYFSFLPFRLQDEAARPRSLGTTEIDGEPYDVVEVTFTREGGGADWEDRFVYWFHRDAHTLDYFAYRYHRDGGGTRFRRAVNRREVDGILLQDYENLTADPVIDDIATYPSLLGTERVRHVSSIELRNLEIGGPASDDPASPRMGPAAPDEGTDPETLEPPPEDGLQLAAGTDRARYAPGDSIRVVVRLANRLDRTRTLSFPTSQRYDFRITTPSGREIYRWEASRSFLQVLGEERLEPEAWGPEWMEWIPAPDSVGDYRLQVVVPIEGGELRTELPLEVAQG